MPESKTFSSRVLLRVYTGCSVPGCTLSEVQEAIEQLLGESVWTHQLASPAPWKRARIALLAMHVVFSDVDTYELTHVCEGKEGSELEAAAESWAAAAVKLLGAEKFDVISGTGRPPREVLGDMLQGLPAASAVVVLH